jgi:protocatechuate 3,4-dioxygenase beta subunit
MTHKHASLNEPQHGHSLSEDLPMISAQLLQRRRALAWLATAAAPALLVAGCGGGSSGSSSSSTTTSSTSSSSTSSSGACIADPSETGGPYPADGTNSSSGATSDVLTASGIVRSDIRSSFISSSTVAPGVLLTITLTLVNTNASCAALSGYAIYLWHCDRSGLYSLYSAPTESYLRGVQVTDSAGQVTFTTIFPACYSGRWPHMHFEVFSSLATATVGTNSVLTSQLAMPSAICSAVYPNVTGYSASVSNFAAVSVASDNVFGDNSVAQIAAMTPAISGSVAAGYTATATIGVAR